MDCPATSFSVWISPFTGMEGSIDHAVQAEAETRMQLLVSHRRGQHRPLALEPTYDDRDARPPRRSRLRPGLSVGVCRHGKPLWCNTVHRSADEVMGQPLCTDCYD